MAITASAQSALQDLSWDESIVPTLRKRLESESRAISKRMSTISFGPGEDGTLQYTQISPPRKSCAGVRAGGVTLSSSVNIERPSGIPRPSLNYSRSSIGSAVASQADNSSKNDLAKRPVKQRSRTYSQPYVADAAKATGGNRANGYPGQSATRTPNALPTPASSRSNSPVFPPSPALEERDHRSTKTTGTKRTGQNAQLLNRPLQTQNKYNTQERWDADEDTYDASYSSIVVDLSPNKQNGILHEAPPFSANSSFVSEADERPSLEERPYEHWYRGDLSRNGGVGELRIGNRKEMLEIASYGHKLRGVKNDTFSRQRRRAESIGHRESVIFAAGHESAAPMVFDEAPLTDMEADTEAETDRDQSLAYHTHSEQTPLEQPKRSEESTVHAISTDSIPATPKRRQPTQIPRTTPNAARIVQQRTASEPLHSKSLSSSSSSMTAPGSRSPPNGTAARIPHSQSHYPASPAQKRGRAKSPAVTAANKKPRPSAAQKRSKSTGAAERLRSTVPSEYPEMPGGAGNMADAIPSWTQPKKAGNWDDVVLPALARKMGLEDQYEEADGSPKANRPSSEIIPPQPGTFGYDPSKRRLRYDPMTGEEIPMEQLDRSERIEEEKTEEDGTPVTPLGANGNRTSKRFSKTPLPAPLNLDGNGFGQNPRRYEAPPSPAPFAQYQSPSSRKPEPMHEPIIEEEKQSGCCGCIIM